MSKIDRAEDCAMTNIKGVLSIALASATLATVFPFFCRRISAAAARVCAPTGAIWSYARRWAGMVRTSICLQCHRIGSRLFHCVKEAEVFCGRWTPSRKRYHAHDSRHYSYGELGIHISGTGHRSNHRTGHIRACSSNGRKDDKGCNGSPQFPRRSQTT